MCGFGGAIVEVQLVVQNAAHPGRHHIAGHMSKRHFRDKGWNWTLPQMQGLDVPNSGAITCRGKGAGVL